MSFFWSLQHLVESHTNSLGRSSSIDTLEDSIPKQFLLARISHIVWVVIRKNKRLDELNLLFDRLWPCVRIRDGLDKVRMSWLAVPKLELAALLAFGTRTRLAQM